MLPAFEKASLQAARPPVGSVERNTLSVRLGPGIQPSATQREGEGHEIWWGSLALLTVTTFQAAAPAVGSVEVAMKPNLPPAKQSAVEGQAMPPNEATPGAFTSAVVQVDAPPVGSAEVKTRSSSPSTAPHSFADAHEMSIKGR